MSLGTKIRELRKAHGLTQTALSDGIVTHGMLSRIERDDVTPSLETLLALSDRLDVPPGFLLDPESDLLPAERARAMRTATARFAAGRYAECLEVFEKTGLAPESECAAIYVYAAYRVGLEAFYEGDFPTARQRLGAAKSALPATVPLAEVAPERIDFIFLLMEHIDDLEAVVPLAEDKPDFGFQPALFFSMLRRVEAKESDTVRALLALDCLDAPYAAFIGAKLKILDYKFIDAILTLRPIAASSELPRFLSLLACAAVENCCKTCEDYKGAYEIRDRREQLLASVKR